MKGALWVRVVSRLDTRFVGFPADCHGRSAENIHGKKCGFVPAAR